MKRSARRLGRLHWIVLGVTFLLIALVAWRQGRSIVGVVVSAAIGLGLLLGALRPDPDALADERESSAPTGATSAEPGKPIEPPRGMGPVRTLLFMVALVLIAYPLIDLALQLTPYRLVWSGAHAISPLRGHELVFVSTEMGEPRSRQVAWVPREWAGGSELAPILGVGPDSVRSGGFAEAYVVRTSALIADSSRLIPDPYHSNRGRARRVRQKSPGLLVHLVRGLSRRYDDSSWTVPPHWVAIVYRTGSGADTGVTILPGDGLRGVGREVLFPRISRLP